MMAGWLLLLCLMTAPAMAEERTISADPVEGATSYELQRKTETGKVWYKVGESPTPSWTYTPPAGKLTHLRICAVRGTEKACPTKFWAVVNEK